MTARTAGIDRNKEIASVSTYVYRYYGTFSGYLPWTKFDFWLPPITKGQSPLGWLYRTARGAPTWHSDSWAEQLTTEISSSFAMCVWLCMITDRRRMLTRRCPAVCRYSMSVTSDVAAESGSRSPTAAISLRCDTAVPFIAWSRSTTESCQSQQRCCRDCTHNSTQFGVYNGHGATPVWSKTYIKRFASRGRCGQASCLLRVAA